MKADRKGKKNKMKNFWIIYTNQFTDKKRNKEKPLFKSFEITISMLRLRVFAFSLIFRLNDKRNNSNKNEVYYFDALYLTLFSNKYYFIHITYNYYMKRVRFFENKYSSY